MEPVLQLAHLNKRFGRRAVIRDLTMDVNAGEVFGFLGPNGAGKTTTIKMILGFLTPDSGTVSVGGHDLKHDYEAAMAQLGGIVENPELYRDLSGRVNLEMAARLHDGVDDARIDEVVALVGMEQRIRDRVKKYSLGMKQRVGLAQALLHRPRLLVLDEPTNGLDPAGIRELRDILRRLAREEDVAVMVSSHLLSEMQLMCDRVGIIHEGELLGVRPVHELTADLSGLTVYRILTPMAEQAEAALTARDFGPVRLREADRLELELDEARVPDALSLLSEAGIPVYGVQKVESTLEDAFLRITGGGGPIA